MMLISSRNSKSFGMPLKRQKLRTKKGFDSSSAAVYGNIEGALDEQMCPKPVNHYWQRS